jgi:hypothetical protein
MPNVVDLRLLNRLDRQIKIKSLHEGDYLEPVYAKPLIEDLNWWYGLLANNALAVTQRWGRLRDAYVDIGMARVLREPDMTAYHRWVIVHEWSHVFCAHDGDYFVMWRNGQGPDPFGRFLNNHQERQAEYIAAYMLIKRRALMMLRDSPNQEIAGILDVPTHLVQLRWYVWGRFGR